MARQPDRSEPREPSRRGNYFGGGLRWIGLLVVLFVVALVIAIVLQNIDDDEPMSGPTSAVPVSPSVVWHAPADYIGLELLA